MAAAAAAAAVVAAVGGAGNYVVVHCGSLGHNVRRKPGKNASVVGLLTRNSTIVVTASVSHLSTPLITPVINVKTL